ncbi:hypothetical protein Q3G72_006697 [Acer saccharum]|nr:hypothetical protein Q3G72_006697 [Acer saccharum]
MCIINIASAFKYLYCNCLHLHVVVCGAIIRGGDVIEIEKVRKYARCIALLFQVVDDILDITKSSKELGKTAGKDLVSDKATYPKLMGIENAKKFARELPSQAIQELAYFEVEKAAPLNHLAAHIASSGAEPRRVLGFGPVSEQGVEPVLEGFNGGGNGAWEGRPDSAMDPLSEHVLGFETVFIGGSSGQGLGLIQTSLGHRILIVDSCCYWSFSTTFSTFVIVA